MVGNTRHFAKKGFYLSYKRCDVEVLDLMNQDSIESFSNRAMEWCDGELFALINNAGAAYPSSVEKITMDDLNDQFQLNVFGHISLTQNFLPAIKKSKGRVLMISSVSAVITVPFLGAYCATKRALEAFSEALALETQPFSIKVINIRPGPYSTDIFDTSRGHAEKYLAEHSDYTELTKTTDQLISRQKLGDPKDLAKLVVDCLIKKNPPSMVCAPFSSKFQASIRKFVPDGVYRMIIGKLMERTQRSLEGGVS